MSAAIGAPDLVARRLAEAIRADADVIGSDAHGTVCLDVPLEHWHDALLAARDHLGMDMLDWLSAVDEPDADPPGVDLVAHLVCTPSAGAGIGEGSGIVRVLLRTRVPAHDLRAPSATDVWAGAAWHERETFEMFGVDFTGFDDGSGQGIRPLLLPEGFEGTPLRKSFVLAARASKAWPGAKEPGESDAHASPSRRKTLPPGVPDASWGRAMGEVIETVARVVGVLAAFLVLPLVVGQAEHKVMAHMQGRLGPMYAGGFHGWAQLVADGVKFMQKEDVTPAAADGKVFRLAPGVALVPYLVAMAAIPLAPGVVGADLDAGLLFVLAASAVGVLGTLMAGWASANKYALLGGLRTAAQLLSYELPLVLAASSVAMAAGSLSLSGIVDAWRPWWLLWQLPALVCFVVAGVAELARPPFDMPVADSEIVFGPYTEYTGLRFAFFLLAEYAGIVVISALTAVLFLGGWNGPGPDMLGVVWTLLKTGLVALLVIWVRVAWPRLREDQLQTLAWKVLVPLALAQLVLTGVVAVGIS